MPRAARPPPQLLPTQRHVQHRICEMAVGASPRRQHNECAQSFCNGSCAQLGLVQHAAKRQQNKRTTGKDSLPKISGVHPGSYCAVSHRHKFIYLHVLKVGGTVTKQVLNRTLGPFGTRGIATGPCPTLLMRHPSYLRWTWARDPYERAYSVYAMAAANAVAAPAPAPASRGRGGRRGGGRGGGGRTSAASRLVSPHREPPADTASRRAREPPFSFEQFWLSDSRWSLTSLHADHGLPQADFLLDAAGCLAVDYIADLDGDRAAELRELATLLGEPELDAFAAAYAQPHAGQPLFRASGSASGTMAYGTIERRRSGSPGGRAQVEVNLPLRHKLRSLFAADFALLQPEQRCGAAAAHRLQPTSSHKLRSGDSRF